MTTSSRSGQGRVSAHPRAAVTDPAPVAAVLCEAKRQYLLTCKVSRFCLLALHDRAVVTAVAAAIAAVVALYY